MAAGAPASQSRWSLNSPTQGNIRLRRAKNAKVSAGASREPQTAMGEDDPIGTVRKPGARTITLEIIEHMGNPEVDWDALEISGEFFTMTREIVGGRRIQYLSCQVSKVDLDDDDEGKHSGTVEIIALSQKKL